MIAARIMAPGKIQAVETEIPKMEKGAILVKMQRGSLCGSDLHMFEAHRPPVEYPLAPGFSGHECVGVVEEASDGAFARGDRVLVAPANARDSKGFAQYVVAPPSYLIKLPADGDMDQLVLSQQLGTVVYCIRKMPNIIDTDVAILGQGPAGLFFTALLSQMGARKLIGIDIVPHRLEVAKKLGATHVVDASKQDPISAVKEITGGEMADVAVEAVGEPLTINQSVDLIKDRGQLVLFGIPPAGGGWEFNFEKFFRKHPIAISSSATEKEKDYRSYKLGRDLIAQNRVDVRPLISHCIPLSQIDKAYELALTKKDGAVKVLIDLQS